MSPKSKRHKKKEDIKCGKNSKSENTSGHKMPNDSHSTYFSAEETGELNSIFKTVNLSAVPAIVGATVLGKLEVLAKLLKQGNEINEIGPNEMTALMWAVKFKNLEAIEFLLCQGADPSMKNGNGDHILLVALENKLWDEGSFITLWNTVRNVGYIDLDYSSKAGHSMLHIAVRREWMDVIGLLIAENANLNVINLNGVTPLMLACFRNNLEMVDALLVAGANVLKEDNRGCLSLCYSISSVVLKNSKPPHDVIDRILFEFSKYNFSFRNYLKKCTKMITNFYKKSKTSTQTTDMLLHVFIFTVRQMKHGFKILMEMNIFEEVLKVIDKCPEDIDTCKAMLLILNETLSCNESCASYIAGTEKEIADKFFHVNGADVCLNIMTKFENNERNKYLPSLATFALSQVCVNNEQGIMWLESSLKNFPKNFDKFLDNTLICIHQGDDAYIKLVKHKVKMFKDKCEELKRISAEQDEEKSLEADTGDDRSVSSKQPTKKSKRRAKALKAKIAKLRGADVTKRYIRGKMIMEQKSNCSLGVIESASSNFEGGMEFKPTIKAKLHPMEEKNIVQEIKKSILDLPKPAMESSKCDSRKSVDLDWLSNTTWNTQSYYEDNQDTVQVFYQKSDSLEQKYYTPRMLDSASEYLKKLLQKIISVYQDHWKRDQELKYIRVPRCHGDTFNKEELSSSKTHAKESPQPSEMKCLARLENEFESLLLTIHSQARTNMPLCQTAINKLENLLLTHEIRGKTIIAESLSSDCYKMYYCPFSEDVYEKGSGDMDHIFTRNFKEFLLNKSEDSSQSDTKKSQYKSTHDSSFSKDVVILSRADSRDKTANEKKAQKKTMDNAYHLLPSILSIFEEDDYVPDESLPICAKASTTSQDCEMNSKSEYSEVLIKALLNQHKQSCIHSSMHHRWCAMIQSLRNSGDLHKFENCGLRVSAKENNMEFIISRTGTFSYVELALDKDYRPFALKRVPRDTETCRNLKGLINPLLGLRNTHILHYYACDYEDDELILATPLCEYNLGQYLMFVKHTKRPLLAPTDLISQFLAGLMYLHHCRGPVVHGNLKPSNIFVDFSGVIRIAEFGIHEALFIGKEAPDSSVIWFSQETYRIYQETNTIQCTTSSDIQVAGMLLHFIWTGGAHPFGRETKEIMKNLEKSSFKLLTRDPDLLDLLTWMLMYEPNDRPAICQVLSHVYFWSSDRKWCFILTCAGVPFGSNASCIDLDELYPLLDQTAINYDIKGSWVVVVKKTFPNLNPMMDDDTPTGLLRFIKSYYDKRISLDIEHSVFRSFILTSFPVLPLSLYRMLQPTTWMKHPAFIHFSTIG